jgi:replication factor C subunit 2/4
VSPHQIIAREGVTCSDDGLEAIIFTADGDMRQALNNLQVRHKQRKQKEGEE